MRIMLFVSIVMCVCTVHAMELSLDHAVSKDMLTKIIACSEPCDRNTLMRVNRHFKELTAKTNTEILLHSPLLLGRRDHAFYMMYHCDEGNTRVVENLLCNGVNANQECMLGISPISLALQNKHYEVADLLRRYHPVGNIFGTDVVSPVYIAVYKGDVERMNYYFDFGLVSMPYSLLHIAVAKGHSAMVSLLIKRLKDFQKNTDDSIAALQIAAKFGYSYIVQLLLPYFSGNEKDIAGDVALYWAAVKGHLDVVQLLIDHGVHINVQNDYGNTALHMAAYNNHSKIVQILLAHFASTDTKNKQGKTALDIACEHNNEKIIELLCNHSCVARPGKSEGRCKIVIRQVVFSPLFSFVGCQVLAGVFAYMIHVYDKYQ